MADPRWTIPYTYLGIYGSYGEQHSRRVSLQLGACITDTLILSNRAVKHSIKGWNLPLLKHACMNMNATCMYSYTYSHVIRAWIIHALEAKKKFTRHADMFSRHKTIQYTILYNCIVMHVAIITKLSIATINFHLTHIIT